LIHEIQVAIEASKNIVVLWSESASQPEWVKAEWAAAVQLNLIRKARKRGVIPCILDDTPLPLFLSQYSGYDFRGHYDSPLSELLAGLTTPGTAAPQPAPWKPDRLASEILRRQDAVLNLLAAGKASEAAGQQDELNRLVDKGLRENPHDRYFLSLAGYNKKNEYIIRHWDDVKAGRPPDDSLLMDAENLFFEAMSIEPDDPSALKGLGSVLFLRRDLVAARFYTLRAIERAKHAGIKYPAAEHDLRLIRRLKPKSTKKARSSGDPARPSDRRLGESS
jgi:tetratricopeptide (TPR) repeat protein